MEKEKISVIIPAYNAEKTIKRCILSIIGGGYSNIEVIVVNDGSTDLTESIIKEIAHFDNRIHFFSQENGGVASARNTGLRNATGQYIAWCDSDDWYEPDFLEIQLSYLKQYDADVSICRAKIEGQNRSFEKEKVWVWNKTEAIDLFFKHKLLNGVLWEKLFKREIFDGIHFDESLNYFEDVLVMWKILQKVNRVVRFEQEKYNFYLHPESLCAQKYSRQRAYCSFKVWNTIVNNCIESGAHYTDNANKRRYLWFFGELKLMLQVDYEERKDVMYIQSLMRNEGMKGLRYLTGFNKLFAVVCIINIPVAKSLLNFVKIVKKGK